MTLPELRRLSVALFAELASEEVDPEIRLILAWVAFLLKYRLTDCAAGNN